ncbi:hypothetical protein BDV23DRAFT_166615 [Aspergillus alliaceus]|uniref:Uncharacterized protein n=1 Tax=Petromyces alliaceus TaxID=209559 RepID=A0A5N7BRS2_PETAA|nr:hypothetical protein BDV23DRAFT_166615 [Aspergillus alliaceus]
MAFKMLTRRDRDLGFHTGKEVLGIVHMLNPATFLHTAESLASVNNDLPISLILAPLGQAV